MMQVDVIGGGAVSQLICRELQASGCSVELQIPPRRGSTKRQDQQLDELRALPWLKGVTVRCQSDAGRADIGESTILRVYAGTPEQWFNYQQSNHHLKAGSPVLLVTSWWDSLQVLQGRLDGRVVPVYPRVAVESWQGRLAVLGQLALEIPAEALPLKLGRSCLENCLKELGLAYERRSMQQRFKARFAQTCFTYWYLVSVLEPRRNGKQGADRKIIERKWQQTQRLVANEPDLQIRLESLEFALAMMRSGNPERSDAAWILKVLLENKRAKIDYFLDRHKRLI